MLAEKFGPQYVIKRNLNEFRVYFGNDIDNFLESREKEEEIDEDFLHPSRDAETGESLVAPADNVLLGVLVCVGLHPEGAFADSVDGQPWIWKGRDRFIGRKLPRAALFVFFTLEAVLDVDDSTLGLLGDLFHVVQHEVSHPGHGPKHPLQLAGGEGGAEGLAHGAPGLAPADVQGRVLGGKLQLEVLREAVGILGGHAGRDLGVNGADDRGDALVAAVGLAVLFEL